MPAHFHRTPRRNAGFSLVELAVTVAVLAIILAIGLPSLRDILTNNRLSGATNEMLGMVQLAKIESIRRNATVDLCPSTNGTTCGGSDWNRVILFSNGANQGVIRELQASNRLTVRVSGNISGFNSRVRFRPDGFAWRGDPTPVQRVVARIQVCAPAPGPTQNARNISLSGARASVDAPAAAGAACSAALAN